MEHELKILPEYFEAVRVGAKTFEVRKNDRNFKVGDTLVLKEWNGVKQEFTGRIQKKLVSYILGNSDYVKEGYVILALDMSRVGEMMLMSILGDIINLNK